MVKKAVSVMVAVAAALLCSQSLIAQTADDAHPAAVHQVAPQAYTLGEQEGVTATARPQAAEGAGVYSVTSAGVDGPLVVDLGWMPAEPNTRYRARFRLRGESLQNDANVYMMIREHEATEKRPFTPYHKTSVRYRKLAVDQAGEWTDRVETFTTSEETHALSGAIVIAELEGELQFSAFELLDAAQIEARARAQAQAEYEQLMTEIREQAAARKPLTPRPLVFSRSQMKYGLERNYYHTWVDRPLLVNRAYRVPRKHVTPFPSYKRILEEVVKYDIDGLAFFPATKGRMGIFELHQQADIESVGLLPEFLPAYTDNPLETKMEILERALNSPYTPRIDGKVLITSYHAASLTPAEWDEILTALRQRHGDTFIFLPALTNVVSLRGPFTANEPISRAQIEEEKAYLRDWLDVCDGIYFNYPAAFRKKDRTFDTAFYRDIFIPVFKSVLSEPAYRDKYLALSAYKSHMNDVRSNSLHEDATRTLRHSFESAMNARPDAIILPEWDEFNENTSFRPTVYGSTTTERILRYYMSRIKGKAPTPVPGDDVSVPNLILSTRKMVTLGEELMIELLNVPDSAEAERYTAELALLDEAGQTVHAFDPVTFDAAQLQEERFYLPTETVPDVRALVPVLTIRGYKGEDLVYDRGFHHVKVRGTWNWDYLYVKQPLRELLQPESAELAWDTPTTDTRSDGAAVLTGSVSSPEDLALVEVLADDDVIYAVDPRDEFFRDDPDRRLVLIEYRSLNTVELEGSLTLKNATADWLARGTVLHQAETKADITDDRIELNSPASIHQRWIRLAIPESEIDAAELAFDFNKAKFSVPMNEVFEKKMISRAFENGLNITIYPYHKQIDMPFHLNEKETSFRVRVWPEIATEQYHLRLTSVSGKTFRTRPLSLSNMGDKASRTLRVYSERQQRGVDVSVAADRIPQLAYDFEPERGAVLLTDAGRPFWATLGGFTNTTTGRGAHAGLFRNYPEQVERTAPVWTEQEGQPCLAFDGLTYLVLPREAIPRRGAFTISLDVKPTSDQDQDLLVHRVLGRQLGLALSIRDGKLHATFRDEDWAGHQFPTDLPVPTDAWSTIRVRYDFETITFTVDGEDASFPLALPAINIGFTVLGDPWRGNGFTGYLRDLSIMHNAQ